MMTRNDAVLFKLPRSIRSPTDPDHEAAARGLLPLSSRRGDHREAASGQPAGTQYLKVRFPENSSVSVHLVSGLGQEPGTGIWRGRNLNRIPDSGFLPEFLSLGTLRTSPVPHWPLSVTSRATMARGPTSR